jgi:hypothetical protein
MILILTFLFTFNVNAQDGIYVPIVQKHVQKVRERWTVEDLFKRKRERFRKKKWSPLKTRMFEMLVDVRFGSAEFNRHTTEADSEGFRSFGAGLQLFWGPVGLGLERDQYKIKEKAQYYQKDDATLFIRLLGPSTQSTHLTFLVGSQKVNHNDFGNYSQNFYGFMSNLYLFRHFGVEGRYRFKPATSSSSHEINGHEYYWGLFWEYSILRVYLNFYQDYLSGVQKVDDSKDDQRIHGSVFGIRLNF